MSSYYTMGRDGLPCPGHAGPRGSEARKAHARGVADAKVHNAGVKVVQQTQVQWENDQ